MRLYFIFLATDDDDGDWHMVQVTSADECWLVQRNYENFKMLDAQLHQCIFDRKISQLPDLSSHPSYGEDVEVGFKKIISKNYRNQNSFDEITRNNKQK